MATSQKKLRTVLVGCGAMGSGHARVLHGHASFELVAVCDALPGRARDLAQPLGLRAHTSLEAMLREEQPQVVVIAAPNAAHAPLTLAAAAHPGVRAIYCEKPVAMCLREARAMREACLARGVLLVIGHQRRMEDDLIVARRLVESGAIGEVTHVRANLGGDVLSDGTHAVDCLDWILGGRAVRWVLAQVHREPGPGGWRFGHKVESGALAAWEYEGGVRAVMQTGFAFERGRFYQDFEVSGTRGRLWRTGDRVDGNLFISDAAGGTLEGGFVEYAARPVPAIGAGIWREVPGARRHNSDEGFVRAYTQLAECLRTGAAHPMGIDQALAGFEVVMAIYESARLHRRIDLPLQQEEFPLDLMFPGEAPP